MSIDRDKLRKIVDEATPEPWGYNGYSAIFSNDNGYDAWLDERLEEGHTLEGRYGAEECPTCGPWTWSYTNPKTMDITTYNGRGCKLYAEDYKREPIVARVPAQYGDTATGRRAKDATFIEAARTAVPELLDLIDKIEELAREARAMVKSACECGFMDWDGVPDDHVCDQRELAWSLDPKKILELLDERSV